MKNLDGWKALPAKIYFTETGETKLWDDIDEEEKQEIINKWVDKILKNKGYRRVK